MAIFPTLCAALCATSSSASQLFKPTEGSQSQKNNYRQTELRLHSLYIEVQRDWLVLTHWSAFIYNHLKNSVLFIPDTFGQIVEVNSKKVVLFPCKIQVSLQQFRFELYGRKKLDLVFANVITSLRKGQSLAMCVNIRFAVQEMEKLRTTEHPQ